MTKHYPDYLTPLNTGGISDMARANTFTTETLPTSLICKECGEEKPASKFRTYKQRNGLTVPDAVCKRCWADQHFLYVTGAPRVKPYQAKDEQVLEKWCSKCELVLPAGNFRPRSKKESHLLSSYCEPCEKAYNNARSRKSLEKYKSDGRAQKANRKATLKRYHGLSVEDYEALVKSQGGRCAICGSDKARQKERLNQVPANFHIDHDHVTGIVRGLLCNNCNAGLGYFRDSVTVLWNAIRYLREAEKHPLSLRSNGGGRAPKKPCVAA